MVGYVFRCRRYFCQIDSDSDILKIDLAASAENDRPLYDVAELANISWPIIRDQSFHRCLRDLGYGFLCFFGESTEKKLRQITPARLQADLSRFLPESIQNSLVQDRYHALIDAARRLLAPFL